MGTPYAPFPEDNAEVISEAIILRWQIDCAAFVEVSVNRTPVATLPAETRRYPVNARPAANEWQITGIDLGGQRAEGPIWRFARDTGGWIATAQPVPDLPRLYTPPPPDLQIDLSSPGTVLFLTCASMCLGMGLVVGVAVLLGLRAQRRERERGWYL
jgi:hypothetical protein